MRGRLLVLFSLFAVTPVLCTVEREYTFQKQESVRRATANEELRRLGAERDAIDIRLREAEDAGRTEEANRLRAEHVRLTEESMKIVQDRLQPLP